MRSDEDEAIRHFLSSDTQVDDVAKIVTAAFKFQPTPSPSPPPRLAHFLLAPALWSITKLILMMQKLQSGLL